MGRMSYAPNALQTPRAQNNFSASQSIQRRSSVYSRPSTGGPMMGQPSFFVQAPVSAGVPQDRRRLRDRGVQNQIAAELEEYLANKGFQMEMKHPLRPDTFRSPTQKDFTMIFQWLYKRIDPAYVFQKSIDYEILPILKQLRYPFEKSITKSQLTAVGGQNWSTLLGMLHWIMQLAVMMERFAEDRYDYACMEEGVDVSGDRIIFRFLSSAYQDWLSCPPGEDEEEDEADKLLVPHVERMAAEFENGGIHYAEELKVLEAENEALTRKIEEAERDMPDLDKLQTYVETLESDHKKFEAWSTNVVEKLKRHEARNEAIKKDIEDWEKQFEEANKEKSELQAAVDKQGIAVSDIDRMNGDRTRLQSGVDAARTRLEEITQSMKEREADAEGRLQNLEALTRQFNSLCYEVGLRGEEYELVININEAPFSSSRMDSSQQHSGDRLLAAGEAGYHPSRILNLDLRGQVKSQINGLRKEIQKRRNDAKDKDEENRRLLFETSAAIEDKKQEVATLEHKVRLAEEEFEKTKEVTAKQKLESDAQIEKMEKDLMKMRSGMNDTVQLMEQREMNTNIE
jgi:kinetochore protein NDC80